MCLLMPHSSQQELDYENWVLRDREREEEEEEKEFSKLPMPYK